MKFIDIIAKEACEKFGIYNYTINSDGSIDVDGDVNLDNRGLDKLPLKFGKVSGNFDCSDNDLITLEGSPQSVRGYFICSNNKLETLEGCPQSVGWGFYCYSNNLISLEGGPQSVGGYFNCIFNQLKDLYGFPEFFDYIFYYSGNPVEEILDLFKTKRLGKVIDLLNEYDVIQQDGKVVILDRLEEVFHMLGIDIPEEIKLINYEVY